jgi:glucokinase
VTVTSHPAGRPVLALDLGASRIRAAAVRPDGSLAARADGATRSAAGPEAVVADSIGLLRAVRDAAPRDVAAALAGIGVCAPGPLDPAAGRLIDPPNFGPGFEGLPLGGPISAALGLPVALERDTVVALLGELAFGAARGASDAVYITVSTGVGGAVLTGGRLLSGADGLAGEIGHMTVDIDGPACGCGGRGHLEALASGIGLARLAAERMAAGSAPGLRKRAISLGRPLTARDLAAAEEAGDPEAAALLHRARRAFAAGMVSVVDLFNPQVIVVGGSLARGQGERLLAPARETIAREGFRVQAGRVRLVPAELGDDVGLVGALGLVGARATA